MFINFTLLAFSAGLLFLQVMLFATSLFLILLVLVQRGKGGGLAGALGGMGGQSAFGSRAGDTFTKITIVTAIIWITLCMVTIAAYNPPPPPKSISQRIESRSGSVISTDTPEDRQLFDEDDEAVDTDPDGAANSLDQGLFDNDFILPSRDGSTEQPSQDEDPPQSDTDPDGQSDGDSSGDDTPRDDGDQA